MKVDELLLLTGNDIPFPQARVNIHQPRIKDIGLIEESNFFTGCHFLLIDKNQISFEDKSGLDIQTNFDIFIAAMNSRDQAPHKVAAKLILALLFPEAKIKIEKDKVLLQFENFASELNKENFLDFQNVIAQMFCFEKESEEFNPADALAKRIAEKIKEGKQKKAEQKGESMDKVAVYSKYVSILAVGLKKSIIDLSNYTIYQLRDEFKRFQLKQDFDIYIKAKLAGAQDLEEVENWMEEIHP
jgi:hypothetical protein